MYLVNSVSPKRVGFWEAASMVAKLILRRGQSAVLDTGASCAGWGQCLLSHAVEEPGGSLTALHAARCCYNMLRID